MVRSKLNRDRLAIFCWFFCVVTVLGGAAVVSWLSLIPKNPHLRISGEHFPTLESRNHSVHRNVSLASNSLIFDLEIFNPNKRMGIYYSTIRLELYRNGGLVGTNSSPAFYQGYKNTTQFQVLIHPRQEFWETMSGGYVDFRIGVETSIRFQIIRWKTKAHRIWHEEQFSTVIINVNGTVSGGNYAKMEDASKVRIKT